VKVLIIDDESSIRFSLKTDLANKGFKVFEAETGEEGLDIFNNHCPQVAIVDIKLPGIDGIEVLKRIKKIDSDCIVIMITYLSEVRLAVKAMKIGAYDYFTKPFALDEINESVNDACRYIQTRRRLQQISFRHELVGEHEKIREIRDVVKRISALKIDTHVLIQGESGTGKEIVARLIHEGKGDNKPFVALNCAATPRDLQESELFGYEKGAFTGAMSRKVGLIEKANGGTLFLDEVGDMDLSLQAKLLRVLQERKFRPVGSVEEISFDATIVSATNKDLDDEVQKGNFRSDLFYRLNVIPIRVPPLRERKEDIPLLIDFFLEEYSFKLEKGLAKFDDEAVNIMMNYSWPGNVRELKNIIERVSIFQEDSVIEAEDLPKDLSRTHRNNEHDNLSPLEMSEQEIIAACLERNDWNISRTSEELGISRFTLRRRIEKYGLR
jgi:two-component system response regulator AtoC